MTVFLLLPQTPVTVIIFAILMGLLWLSTVPPTNGLVAIMFGTRHLGMLGGVVFLSHQIGSFLGVWLGGYLYDQFAPTTRCGGWRFAGLFAAVMHWPIKANGARRAAASERPSRSAPVTRWLPRVDPFHADVYRRPNHAREEPIAAREA